VKSRAAVTAVFFVNGALFASWVSRIPAGSHRFDAGTGSVCLALAMPAIAALVTLPVVGRVLPDRSSRPFWPDRASRSEAGHRPSQRLPHQRSSFACM